MTKVALLGSNGQLSHDILKVFPSHGYKVFPLDLPDFDITDFEKSERMLMDIKPEIVVNTVAYHKTDEVEDNPKQAYIVNSAGQQKVSEVCARNGWTIVYTSTDYVFGADEERKTPYIETDTPGPVNVVGVSKLAGEYVTKFTNPKHFILRVSGLFGVVGSAGKGGNFVELMVRLGKEKGQVKVVNDQIISPTYTMNIAENMAELLKTDKYGLYHMSSMGECSWWEFAKEIFNLLAMKNVKCDPVPTAEMPTRSKRPKYSVLAKRGLDSINLNNMKTWQENLKNYLIEKGYLR